MSMSEAEDKIGAREMIYQRTYDAMVLDQEDRMASALSMLTYIVTNMFSKKHDSKPDDFYVRKYLGDELGPKTVKDQYEEKLAEARSEKNRAMLAHNLKHIVGKKIQAAEERKKHGVSR